MNRITCYVVFLSLFSLQTALAQGTGRQYVEISGTGQSLYPIAVAPILGSERQANRTLQSVLANDLKLIGIFKVLDPRGFLANPRKEGIGINPQSWTSVGAQAVVKARARRMGGQVAVEWYLYLVGKGRRAVLRKSYRSKNLRRLAHRFGDDIVKFFTKERGIFSTQIAFSSGSGRRRKSQIYVMDFDGHGAHRVSRTGKQNILPAWAPDKTIAYTSFYWRNPDLYFTSPAGGRPRRVSRFPGLNTGAAFSPRGGSIALTLSKDGNAEIYLINRRGRALRRLTRNRVIDTSPTFSPDGKQLAFVSNRGGSPQIYIMSNSGGGVRRLTFAGNYNQEPDWCPRKDTPLVAFTGRDSAGKYDIFTINVKTGELKRLTQGQGSNKSPSWAPNGRLIVFSSSRGGLWVMTADGLNQSQIYKGSAKTPAWSGH